MAPASRRRLLRLGRFRGLALRFLALIAFAVAATMLVAARAPGYSTSVSPGLVQRYSERFGQAVPQRLTDWAARVRLERSQTGLDVIARLQRVNSFVNRIRFIDDIRHWAAEDYWATPAETLASNGGDCEDYAIAKYFMLKELGFPRTELRMVYVYAIRLRQPHMVLAWYARPDAEPWILDNVDDVVRPASQRPDLIPVFSFNDDEVVVAGTARRTEPLRLRGWRALVARLEEELRL